MKDRTEQEHFDHMTDNGINEASRPDAVERRPDGKHGSVLEQTMRHTSRFALTSGSRPESDRNRRVRTRMLGGVAVGLLGQSSASRFCLISRA